MKIVATSFLLLLALVTFAIAQESPGSPRALSACGPLAQKFKAGSSAAQPPSQPEAGKALVYVIERFRNAPGELSGPTIRVGMDGAWMGATRANSYLFFLVDPGEHHLCTSWQSHLKALSSLAALNHLSAEAGKTYYFRARITYSGYNGSASMDLDLEPVDVDEGHYLVAIDQASNSHPNR